VRARAWPLQQKDSDARHKEGRPTTRQPKSKATQTVSLFVCLLFSSLLFFVCSTLSRRVQTQHRNIATTRQTQQQRTRARTATKPSTHHHHHLPAPRSIALSRPPSAPPRPSFPSGRKVVTALPSVPRSPPIHPADVPPRLVSRLLARRARHTRAYRSPCPQTGAATATALPSLCAPPPPSSGDLRLDRFDSGPHPSILAIASAPAKGREDADAHQAQADGKERLSWRC